MAIHNPSRYFKDGKFEGWLRYKAPNEGYNSQVIRFLGLERGEFILDDGCGNGRFSLSLADEGAKVVSLDINKFMAQATKIRAVEKGLKQIDVIIADCQNLPFRDLSFDKVLNIHNMWYVPLYHKAMNEMLRVTKIGGKIAVDQVNEKANTAQIGWHKRFLCGIYKFIQYALTKIRPEIVPKFFRTPEQFLLPFANYRTIFYSVSSPPLLCAILGFMPLPNVFQRVKNKLRPFSMTKGFDPLAQRWLAICEKGSGRISNSSASNSFQT